MTHLRTTSNILKPVLYLLPALLLFNNMQAQSYIAGVQKLSVEDGLSNRFVTSICKDSRGFMWIGTQYGLNRYDGYAFKHYTKENSTLTSNYINKIYEDQQQRLWIIQKPSKAIIDIMDPHTGRIQNFDTVFKNISRQHKPSFSSLVTLLKRKAILKHERLIDNSGFHYFDSLIRFFGILSLADLKPVLKYH